MREEWKRDGCEFLSGIVSMEFENVPSSPSLTMQEETTNLLNNLSIANSAPSLSLPQLPVRSQRRKLTAETSTS
jgi:hypothetical protein